MPSLHENFQEGKIFENTPEKEMSTVSGFWLEIVWYIIMVLTLVIYRQIVQRCLDFHMYHMVILLNI